MSTMRRSLPLILLLLATAVCYAALWPASFSWDDEALVRDNQLTGSLHNLPAMFQRDLWGTTRISTLASGYYRPLFLVSLALDRALFGLSAMEAHIHSLCWHLLAVGALYALLTRLFDPARALLGAAVFALHPVQSEVLALVAARNDSMAAALSLFALVLVLPRERPSVGRLVGAGLLLFLALLSKESAVLVPLMLLALDLARWRRPGALSRYLALGVGLFAYAGLRAWAGIGGALVPEASSFGLVLSRLPQICGVYAGLLVWPWPLSPARHLNYLPALPAVLPGLVAFSVAMALMVWKGERRGLVLCGLAWAALCFAPSLAATLDKGLLGERYLYFPIAGLGFALAAAISRPPRWLVPAFAVPCIAVLQLRLPQWHDSRTVWQAANDAAPTPFTHGGLAWYLRHEGQLKDSLPHFLAALAGDPPYRDVCELIVAAYLEADEIDEAARIGTWAVNERGCPKDGEILSQTSLALAWAGRWEEAVAMAKSRPGGPEGAGVLVIAASWARAGRLDAVTALAPRVPGPTPFTDRVAKVLRKAGDTATADKVAALGAH